MELFWEPLKTKEGRKAFLHFAKSLNNEHLMEIEDQLRTLDVPVLIIRGEADPYLSSEIAIKLHKEIKNSILEAIAQGSHFIQEDEPEQLSILIKNFIERNKHVRGS
jgi:pimeloyl-ACP methyl ester carboxylesterase